jgi:chorismate mutase/prephenate dehydratase
MNLEKLRNEIDSIDDELAGLLIRRMEVANEVAMVKLDEGGPVHQPQREVEVLKRVCEKSRPELHRALKTVYGAIFQASRAQQHSLLAEAAQTQLGRDIVAAVARGQNPWEKSPSVACQGIEGAYSHIAARHLFEAPRVMSMRSFEAVFRAVEQGLCRYGVLPIENSTYGSVTAVYDLLREHKCSIVRAARLPIHHCLLSGERFLMDVKEIYSHEQAIRQCADFLEKLGDRVKIHVCENTAVAARLAAESDRPGTAAISSEECAELYGLNVLKQDIQSLPDNETRFICIARQAEIYPGANKTSVLISLQHRPGSLAAMLQLIAGMGINLTKLENRPAGSEFEVVFYLDMDCNAGRPEHARALEELARHSEEFQFLGSYTED